MIESDCNKSQYIVWEKGLKDCANELDECEKSTLSLVPVINVVSKLSLIHSYDENPLAWEYIQDRCGFWLGKEVLITAIFLAVVIGTATLAPGIVAGSLSCLPLGVYASVVGFMGSLGFSSLSFVVVGFYYPYNSTPLRRWVKIENFEKDYTRGVLYKGFFTPPAHIPSELEDKHWFIPNTVAHGQKR